MQVEADDRCRCVGLHVEHAIHGKYREQIPVRMVAFRRARPAIAGCAEIGACLQRARRQRAARATSAFGEFTNMRRDVDHQPVPEARASRRIGVVARDGKILRLLWRARHLRWGDLLPPAQPKPKSDERMKSLGR
jgi:hypothetical protein